MKAKKIGIIATHPIQYQVPWYRALVASQQIDLKVYYGLLPDSQQQSIGFGKAFEWDVPLLDGYAWECLDSAKESPGLHGFWANSTPGLARKFRDDKLDALIITGWHAYPMLQALGACMRLGLPRMVRGESNAMRARNWKARLCHRLLLPRYDAYLAIGESSAAFYRSYGIADERIFLARYFIDNARFTQQYETEKKNRDQYRRNWGIAENATCYIYVGKLEPKKRIFDILEALKLCKNREPEVHLLVVGTGELEDEARRIVEQHALPVTFAGFMNQSEISRAYVAADVSILPSDYGETWGLVVNEGMVAHLPALISDRVGCGADLICGHNTGRVFAFADTRALADAMLDMASDPKKLKEMGENAYQRIKQYDASAAAQGTLEAVAWLLDEPSKRT